MIEYTVSLGGFSVSAETPLEAAKQLKKLLQEIDLDRLIYDVVDDESKQVYTVDLSEEDEDAVLENKS